jgi:hypothetical protein
MQLLAAGGEFSRLRSTSRPRPLQRTAPRGENMMIATRLRVPARAAAALALAGLGACGGEDAKSPPAAPVPPATSSSYTVGGTVAGLGAGKSLVLRNSGAADLAISANGKPLTKPVGSWWA